MMKGDSHDYDGSNEKGNNGHLVVIMMPSIMPILAYLVQHLVLDVLVQWFLGSIFAWQLFIIKTSTQHLVRGMEGRNIV